MGAQLCKEVASKTNDDTGDGTTTATILAQAIVKGGLRNVAAGANAMLVKRGIEQATETAVKAIREASHPLETSEADAMDKVGKDGVITVEESKVGRTEMEIVEGMQFDKGYVSPYFATEAETMQCVLEDAYILTYEKKISSAADIVPLLEKIAGAGGGLVVIAEDIEAEALATMVVNKMRGSLSSVAVKAPGFGDRRKRNLEDLAVLTGGTFISEDLGIKLDSIELDDLGRAERVVITKDDTTIISGAGTQEELDARVAQIRREIEDTDSDYDREKLEERLAKLAGGVAVLKVGAATEVELKELKHRFEDALSAARSGIEEGIVPGGGVVLARAVAALDKLQLDNSDEQTGVEIVKKALVEPLRQIAANAGYEGSVVLEDVLENDDPNFGFNALTEEFVDLVADGVVDPAKVVRCALENAASVGALVLTTEAVIAEIPEETPAMPPGGGMPPDYM